MAIEFSIVLCSRNRAKLLKDALASLLEVDYPGDRFELVTLGPEDAPHRAPAAAIARAHDALVSHRHVVAARPGFLLLRPDGFVAASGGTADLGPLGDAIARLARSTKELRA